MSQWTMPRGHLSFSQLVQFANCGEAYRLKYVEQETSDGLNLPMLAGSALHWAIEQFELHLPLKYDSPTAQAELTKLTRKHVTETMEALDITEADLVVFGKQDLKDWMGKGIPNIAKQYLTARCEEKENGWELYYGLPEVKPLEVEVAYNKPPTQLVPVKGVIDQVMLDSKGRIVIRDIKTGKPKPEHALQLEMYAQMFQQTFPGHVPAYGQVMYLSRGTYKYQVVPFNLSGANFDRMINQTEQSIVMNLFPVTGPITGACGQCDFSRTCEYAKVESRGES